MKFKRQGKVSIAFRLLGGLKQKIDLAGLEYCPTCLNRLSAFGGIETKMEMEKKMSIARKSQSPFGFWGD